MKVVITGAGGQLAYELERTCPSGTSVTMYTIDDLDICNSGHVDSVVGDIQPDVIINTAAYTAVDQAESDIEPAYAVNAEGPAHLAQAAKAHNSRLVQISTDFVFDGKSTVPYLPTDQTGPLSVYGKSKLAGEISVQDILGGSALIVRGGWLYSSHSSNFVLTMLRVMNAHERINVVNDQRGTPTWSWRFAVGIWAMISHDISGLRHWGNSGSATWFEFATEIYRHAVQLGFVESCILSPVSTAEYPTAATRPAFSVLNHDGLAESIHERSEDWKVDLRTCMSEITPS